MPDSTIGREIGQTRPFRTRSQEAVLALLRTSDVLRRYLGQTIGAAGITRQQYNVLRILRGAEPDGLPTLAIARRMLEQSPGVTRMIDRLIGKGLVRRGAKRGDRRCVICRISAAGLDVLARLDGPVDASDDAAFAAFDDGEIRTFVALLDKLRAGCARSD